MIRIVSDLLFLGLMSRLQMGNWILLIFSQINQINTSG